MPAAQMPAPSAPRSSKAGLPKQEGTRKPPPKNGKASEKPRATKETKAEKGEKTGERVVPKVKPPPPVRTDTMVLSQVPDRASPGIPTGKKGGRWVWFVLPGLALAAVGGFIGWDIYNDRVQRQLAADAEEVEAPQEDLPPEPKAATRPEPEVAPEPEPPKDVPAPKKKVPPPAKVAKAAGSPGEAAMRALQGDFQKLLDDGVQRKFRLQLSALEGQVDDKGSDPAFVKKVESLHEQVKTALAKQQ
jgi:hypothetical protein